MDVIASTMDYVNDMSFSSMVLLVAAVLLVRYLCTANLNKAIFDATVSYYMGRFHSADGDKLIKKWYGSNPDLTNSSPEALAVMETMRPQVHILTSVDRIKMLGHNTKWLLGAGPEQVDSVRANGVDCSWVRWSGVTNEERGSVIMFMHGGGYISGDVTSHTGFLGRLSRQTRLPCFNVGYRTVVVGESTVHDAIDDCVAAYRYLVDTAGYSPKNIIFCGDSAGGGLCVSTMQRLRKSDMELPLCSLCISPFVDSTFGGESCKTNAGKDFVVHPVIMEKMRLYLEEAHGGDVRHPEVSPLNGSMEGLAPMWIGCTKTETLKSDSTRLAEKALGCDVEVDLYVSEGYGFHTEACLSHLYPEAFVAMQNMCNFLEKKLAA